MSTSLIIGNNPLYDGNITNTFTVNLTIIGSYIAPSFWGFENKTINRIFFSTGPNVSGNTRFSLIAGIGTFDRNTGYPSLLAAGVGHTLNFSTSTKIDNVVGNTSYIVAVNDFNIEPLKKYFIGIAATNTTVTGTFGCQIALKANNNPVTNYNTSPIYTRGAAGLPTVAQGNGDDRFVSYNWGYDSGNAKTEWLNPFVGPTRFVNSRPISLSNILGFTFCMNTDFESIYVDKVKILAKNGSSLFPTGFGSTFHCVLYDSDGTTALSAHTHSIYTTNSTQINGYVMPIKKWLDNKKIYHIAFAGETESSTGNSIAVMTMPYEFQSSFGFTSIYFSKSNGAATPSYSSDLIIPFHFVITDIRGSLQNSEGRTDVF